MFQTLWDIQDRNKVLYKQICDEILRDLNTDFSPTPRRERDTRWLTNGRSAINILRGYYIQDENGTPFWILLAQRLTYIKKDSDWQVARLNAFIKWLMKPEMIFSVWVEAEVVLYFEVNFGFHAVGGQLCVRPGFRLLELFCHLINRAFKWWHRALLNPESRFPNACKWIKEQIEEKGMIEMANMKREQLKYRIKYTHDKMVKM